MRKRNEDLLLRGNLDSLEAGLAELSNAPKSAPTSKKGMSTREANAQAVEKLEAQLDALSTPHSKSARIPAPATPVQMNKAAMNPDYVERTMSPARKPPKSVTVVTHNDGDNDDFNPRAEKAKPQQSRSKRGANFISIIISIITRLLSFVV